eukprot:Sspe_Gene.112605::Locus_95672_Transcript_1_1_Confidence_1.000_Length_405::g.112605::m.112605
MDRFVSSPLHSPDSDADVNELLTDLTRVDEVLKEEGKAQGMASASSFDISQPPIIPFNLSMLSHVSLSKDDEPDADLFDLSPEDVVGLKKECSEYIDNLQ